MSQHDYVIDNQDGASFRVDINNALQAGATLNSGATAPATTYAFMWWADTTLGFLKQRNSSNTAWVAVMPLATQVEPAGIIKMFGGATAPSGYLACDGGAVSRTTYAALFAAVGTTHGVGDGSTTFNVPDFRRRVPVGAGGTGTAVLANTLGSKGGFETHTLLTTEIPVHSHDIYAGTDNTSGNATSAGATTARGLGGSSSATGLAAITNLPASAQKAVRDTGGGGAHNNVQPSIVVNYIIKT
jgi:microcystin-dependent protein